MAKSSKTPIVAEVINSIRRFISSGRFKPGQILSEKELILALANDGIDVSRMPVRQATAYFENHSIMEVQPKIGTWVRKPTDAEVKEIWGRRMALEEFALVQLAGQRPPILAKIEATQRAMRAMISSDIDLELTPTDEERRTFIDLDESFHQEIAIAAGYPLLGQELSIMRLKLRLAVDSRQLLETKRRFAAIIREHDGILRALKGDGHDGIRPDLNGVRFAFFFHMRKAGKESWRLADKVLPAEGARADGPNFVFDLPDLPPIKTPVSYLFGMRMFTELSAAWNLAKRPETRIDKLDTIQAKMVEAHNRSLVERVVSTELERRFINLDIDFHAALCFLGGILFGDELITFAWHQVYATRRNPLDSHRMQTIIDQHENILQSIRRSRGEHSDVKAVSDAVEEHLRSTFAGNNFDESMRTETAEMFKQISERLSPRTV